MGQSESLCVFFLIQRYSRLVLLILIRMLDWIELNLIKINKVNSSLQINLSKLKQLQTKRILKINQTG